MLYHAVIIGGFSIVPPILAFAKLNYPTTAIIPIYPTNLEEGFVVPTDEVTWAKVMLMALISH